MSSDRATNLSSVSNINSSEGRETVPTVASTQYKTISSTPTSESRRFWALQKALAVYRLKHVCAQPCPVFAKGVLNRIPSGKGVYLILLMLGLEQLAYSSAADYLLYPFIQDKVKGELHVNLVRSIVIYLISFPLFPVMGWIADVWVGQYRMIHFSLWLLWLGYAALTMLFSVNYVHPNVDTLPLLFVIISIGHSGFQAAAIPFGAEMIKYRTTQELSSYFHCYYWVRNLGFTIFFITSNCGTKSIINYLGIIFTMVAVACTSMALIINGLFKHHFSIKWESINPYKKVLQVLYLAMVIKRPVHRSAFSFTGAKPPSRLSLTKTVHGGKFSSEEVEDVKTFLRLLVILFCILLALMITTEIYQVMPTQLLDMDIANFTRISLGHLHCRFADKFSDALNVFLILLILPILNFAIFPLMREYMPNMLKRIGMGAFLALLAQVSILAISGMGSPHRPPSPIPTCMFSAEFGNHTVQDKYAYSSVPVHYALLPHILGTIAEILINVTSLEFFYAQSPHKMRGMMVGLFFFSWGLSAGLSRIMIFFFGLITSSTPMTCDFWYYLLYMFVAVVAFVCYVFMAPKYQNRQRGEEDSDRFYRSSTYQGSDVFQE